MMKILVDCFGGDHSPQAPVQEFMDYQNYGGSVLLGTLNVVVKGHGSSNAVAVEQCIAQAYRMEKSRLSAQIEKEIAQYEHYED